MFRVGVYRVPAAQAGLVRALIQLLSRGSSDFLWSFAAEGPYDALIVDSGSAADLSTPELMRSARALSILGSPSQPVPPDLQILEWPLRAEKLESWLTQVQQRLPAPQEPPNADDASGEDARYRLKRWPPQALMRSDPERIRMAALMSRRHLSTAELARLSGQDVERCRTFLQMLQGFSLLDAVATTVQAQPVNIASPPATTLRKGVIQSIRRRLGM